MKYKCIRDEYFRIVIQAFVESAKGSHTRFGVILKLSPKLSSAKRCRYMPIARSPFTVLITTLCSKCIQSMFSFSLFFFAIFRVNPRSLAFILGKGIVFKRQMTIFGHFDLYQFSKPHSQNLRTIHNLYPKKEENFKILTG